MYYYSFIAAAASAVAGLLIAVFSKKQEGVVYGKLDKAGRITNIVLIPIYACLAPVCLFLGIIANPSYDSGVLGVLGWTVAIVQGSAMVFCSLGLGFSVALRKKGKSKQSFAMQFLGFGGIALAFILFFAFYGNLLKHLN